MNARKAASLALLSAVTLGAVAVLVTTAFRTGSGDRGTPAPPASITNPVAHDQFDALLGYARSLDYDSVTHHAADDAWLIDRKSGANPRFVEGFVVPERHANAVPLNDLEGSGQGKGRIVAMIWVDPTDSLGYAPLNLPPGRSYVWVDNLTVKSDTTGTARVIIIPDKAGERIRVRPAIYVSSKSVFANYGSARWLVHRGGGPKGNCTNVPCGNHGCCQSCP
jgi:hypothetical protein